MTIIKFDQHFLTSKRLLKLETDIAKISKNDIILEIGPGNCSLTKQILKYNPKKLISIEIDEKFKNNLEEIKNRNENFEYFLDNSLNIIETLNFTKIIANIPYSITEPLYKKLIYLNFNCAILIHGKRFYDEVLKNENSKLHHILNSYFIIKKIEDIDGKMFLPKAKVKSCLVRIEKNAKPTKIQEFFKLLHEKETRTTKNAIIFSFVDYFNISKNSAKEIYTTLNINTILDNKKLSNISNNDFLIIIEKIKEFSKFKNL